jgi:hypothetical protein
VIRRLIVIAVTFQLLSAPVALTAQDSDLTRGPAGMQVVDATFPKELRYPKDQESGNDYRTCATGIPPQMIKGQIDQETIGRFDPKTWRYEPLTIDLALLSTRSRDLRKQAPYKSFLLPTIGDSVDPGNCGAGYDYATHVDSRILDTSCRGLPQGTAFSTQVMNDIANSYYKISIPVRDATGNVVFDGSGQLMTRHLRANDQFVSIADVIDYSNDKLNWYDATNSPQSVNNIDGGVINFSAQFSLASSYGYLQVLYTTAIDMSNGGGQWSGTTACGTTSSPMDPDNLFDTTCSHNSGGGSLNIGTRITERNFSGKWGSSPSVPDEATMETTFFSRAYQKYNPGLAGYGADVINKARKYEPIPLGAIFTTGGQQ